MANFTKAQFLTAYKLLMCTMHRGMDDEEEIVLTRIPTKEEFYVVNDKTADYARFLTAVKVGEKFEPGGVGETCLAIETSEDFLFLLPPTCFVKYVDPRIVELSELGEARIDVSEKRVVLEEYGEGLSFADVTNLYEKIKELQRE